MNNCNVIGFKYRSELLEAVELAKEKYGEDKIDYAYADQINNLKIRCDSEKEYKECIKWEIELKSLFSLW